VHYYTIAGPWEAKGSATVFDTDDYYLTMAQAQERLGVSKVTFQKRVRDWGLATYRDPLGSNWQILAALPIDKVEPTPFQRDLSDAHHKRLADVISKTGRFLDPVISVVAPDGSFWTPNGRHRLEAMRRLGAKSITALVVPEREVAWQILALNTEKAHNLKERSLEVIRIYRGLVEEDPRGRPDATRNQVWIVHSGCRYRDAIRMGRSGFASGRM